MKLFFIYFFSIILIFSVESKEKIKNSIIAKVGNQVITSVDLVNEMTIITIINQLNVAEIDKIQLRNSALKNLIKYSIKTNEINNFGITRYNINNLNDTLDRIKKGINLNEDQLINLLNRNGIGFQQFKDRFKVNLLWNSLIFQIYKNQIEINPLELENNIKRYLSKHNKKIEYKLSELEFVLNEKSLDEVKDLINKTIEKEGFKKAVKLYSISDSNITDGEIGWINYDSLSSDISKELKKMTIGEISQPIKKENSYMLLKLNDLKIIDNINKEDLEEVNQLKNRIINQKKEEKLNLFSRSHYTKVENSILIEINE